MFETLQNIRVFMTCSFCFCFFEGGLFCFSYSCYLLLILTVWTILWFPLEINIKLKFIRFLFISLTWANYFFFFKKEEKKYLVYCTSNRFVPICRLSGVFFVFPFFHCTFNLRLFLYLLDINVLPFW